MQIIYSKTETMEINRSITEQLEEDNRNDVISLAMATAEAVAEKRGKKVKEEAVRLLATKWFEKHKDNDEEFADELASFLESLEERFENDKRSIWIYGRSN